MASLATLQDPARFIFLDETGTATNMARRYGRSPSDRRLVAAVAHGHWRTTTFIVGLRQTRMVAPLLLDGPIIARAFRAYVGQCLARRSRPATWSCSTISPRTRSTACARQIAAAGASILYLPPCSPDLNPIEQLFAKLKALPRKAAARTKEQLWSTIAHLLDACPATECANYLRHWLWFYLR